MYFPNICTLFVWRIFRNSFFDILNTKCEVSEFLQKWKEKVMFCIKKKNETQFSLLKYSNKSLTFKLKSANIKLSTTKTTVMSFYVSTYKRTIYTLSKSLPKRLPLCKI